MFASNRVLVVLSRLELTLFQFEATSQFPMCVVGFWFVDWLVRTSCLRAQLCVACLAVCFPV